MKKRYLVTGASRGIGEALVRNLEADGHHVIGVSRTTARCKHWLQADVTADAGIDAVAHRVAEDAVDALLHVAGAWESHAFTEQYDFLNTVRSETRNVMALNLVAPILLSQTLALALAKSDSPKIILFGSTSGLDSVRSKEVAYTASKCGLRGVSRTLALALRPLNIHVSILNLGDVATPEVLEDCKLKGCDPDGLIPLSEVIRAVKLVLHGSNACAPGEIDLFETR